MLILPAIDLRQGRCVRLLQGREQDETVYDHDPAAVAERFVAAGAQRLHLVDLDGAFRGQGAEPRQHSGDCAAHPDSGAGWRRTPHP